jgi:hypothetical protein
MDLKAASVRRFFPLAAVFITTLLFAQSSATNSLQQNAFDEKAASQMLLQLSEALQGHSQKQFLALFDLPRMKDGELFKQQIASFYSQTESIRAHLNLAEFSKEGDQPSFTVEAEMETEPRNGGPSSRKSERLTFTVANRGGWKIVEMQPRSFFTLP